MLEDKTLLGKIYVGDNENVIFAVNREDDIDVSYIYLMNDNGDCKILLEDKYAQDEKKLNFNRNHQIYGTYRLRQGCEKTIYFTDNYNPPRYLNINDVDSFKEVFVGEDKNIMYGDVDADKLRLQKTYKNIPDIKADVDSSGVLMPGSYNFSVRYVDEDLNPTEWIYTTEPVMIYHDCTSKDYINTRVSGGNDVEYRKYESTNKSIKVSVDNRSLDHSFIYVQFAMICANTGHGIVNDVQYSPLIELDFEIDDEGGYKSVPLTYVFRGDDKTSTGTTDEIKANTLVFDKAKCLEQADNRLVMGNVTEMDIDWCKLQRYASKIDTRCVVENVALDKMPTSHKDSMFAFNKGVGYQPGEIYSFGIVYVFENGVKSPVYHIPGRDSLNDGSPIGCMASDNACTNIKYSNVSSGCEGFDYWGVDCNGNKLAGEPVRHHRFPTRNVEIENNVLDQKEHTIMHYNLIVGLYEKSHISGKFKRNFDKIYIRYDIVKEKNVLSENSKYLHGQEVHQVDYVESEREENDLYLEYDLLHNGKMQLPITTNPNLVQNSFLHGDLAKKEDSGRVTIGGWKDNKKAQSLMYLKKSKQFKFVDLVAYDMDDYDNVRFEFLQEYPQLVENSIKADEGQGRQNIKWMTTNSVISTGWLDISNNEELFENAEETEPYFFRFNRNTGSESTWEDGGRCLYIGPVVKFNSAAVAQIALEGALNPAGLAMAISSLASSPYYCTTNKVKFNKDTHALSLWAKAGASDQGTGNGNVYIASCIGFHVEAKTETKRDVYYNLSAKKYGVKFSNIQIPNDKYLNGHKVIGYYIVQNERTKQDMTVLDSAIMLPLFTENSQEGDSVTKNIVSSRMFAGNYGFEYQEDNTSDIPTITIDASSSQWSQEDIDSFDRTRYQYLSNLNGFNDKMVLKRFYKNGVAIVSPRMKFNKEELFEFKFAHTGNFTRAYIDFSDKFDDGWITQDVQAGTSYNKKINKKKDRDNDGFDLHVFSQNTFVEKQGLINSMGDNGTLFDFTIGNQGDIHYLRPCSEIDKFIDGQNYNVINTSGDNSICIVLSQQYDFTNMFCREGSIVKIPYGYLVRDMEDYYTDFQQRPYYIASELRTFEDNTDTVVFNGDCYVSPMKYSTGTLFDIRMKKRNKKATWWQYVVGALGAVGGTVGAIWTGGATAALVGPSIALIQNGIRVDKAFQAQKKFIDSGGKKILTDNWIKNCVDIEQDDDEIQWVFESIDGLWFESIVNMNMRVGATITNVTDYLDPIQGYNPSEMRMYYMNKLTWPDKDHNDGRMYLGYAQAEIYDINKDFERRNREKEFYTLGIEHECCSDCENKFPQRLVYSQKSFSEEKTDNYKVFLPANYKDIDGEAGSITEVSFNGTDAFLVLTTECAWQLAPSKQQQVNPNSNVVSFIGTGDYFDQPAIRLAHDSVNQSYGCKHQASVLKTKYGTLWFSEHDNAIYMLGNGKEGIKSIFEEYGMSKWFEREGRIKLDDDFYSKYRYEYPMKDNTSSEIGTGYVLGYDYLYDRILITKKDSERYIPGNCAYDGKERGLEAVKEYVAQNIEEFGWYNVCYKWSQEECCYIIDYEESDGVISHEHREKLNAYDTQIEMYYDRYKFNMMLNEYYGNKTRPTFEDNGIWDVEIIDGNIIYRNGSDVMSYKKEFYDNSWTISFKPGYGFVSFHSYMPNMYISTSNGVYSWIAGDNNIYRHNSKGEYLGFYGKYYPFVLELVDKDDKTIAYGNSLMESVSVMTEAKRVSNGELLDVRNIFFDYGYFYNGRQMTDFVKFISKHDLDGRNYLDDYMDLDDKNIPVEKRDIYWHINDIRDNVSDYDAPMFLNDISDRIDFMAQHNMNGWIDKAINNAVFENKDWWDIEPFKDVYICQRYFYDKPNIDSRYKDIRFGVLLNTTDKKLNLDNIIE